MAMPSDGEIERSKRDGRMCVVRGWGGDGPLCKREQLSPAFSNSPRPLSTVGPAVGPSVGPIPL